MTEEKKPKNGREKKAGKGRAFGKRPRSRLTREERKKRRKQEVFLQWVLLGIVVFGAVILFFAYQYGQRARQAAQGTPQTETSQAEEGILVPRPDIDVQLLTVNEYSRPGIATDPITAIVIHYLANPGTTAQENRDYFENLKDYQTDKVSSNFIVGLEGEIIQCVPTSEMAYASNSRNHDTVSIENCHPDESGRFNESTYQSLVHLTAYLCDKFDLDPLNGGIIRHYDVTGKICPKYFVENEEAWTAFQQEVADYMARYGAY